VFDWRDNLELARALGRGAPGTDVSIRISEATDRCAVGRAYYAAFGHARECAIQRLGFVSSGGAADHGRLAAHFHLHGMPVIAFTLRNLHRWRNACDYDGIVPSLATMVGNALRESAAVIQRL
jgi:hypothetical protein